MSDVSRRSAIIGGLVVATFPGMGGTPDRPAGYIPPDLPGVSAGSNNVIVARRVIIIGTGGELLVYSPSAGAGNLINSIAGAAFTDQYGNHGLAGVASYSASFATALATGFVAFYSGSLAGGWAAVSEVAGDASGNLQINSGGQLQLIASTNITLQGSASTGVGDNGGVTSGPSGTVNSFPAAGPNHTHAEIHHHPYHP